MLNHTPSTAQETAPTLTCFPSSYALLRFSALPWQSLAHLRFTRSVACMRELLLIEAWFQEQRDALSDLLYAAVPTVSETQARRILLDIRRAMFNDRPHKGGLAALRTLRPHLERPVRQAIVRWYRRMRRYQRLRQRLEATFVAELHERRDDLRKLLGRDDFLKGVLISSVDFYDALTQYLATPCAEDNIQYVEISALLYLARMATKTSPFATFTPTALGSVDPRAPGGLSAEIRGAIVSRVRLNTALIHVVARFLAHVPAIQEGLPVFVRDSFWLEDDKICFVRPYYISAPFYRRQDLVQRLPLLPGIQRVIQLVQQHPGSSYGELVRRLSDGTAEAERKARKALQSLIDHGLLICHLPFSPHDDDPLQTLLGYLEAYEDQLVVACRQRLTTIQRLFSAYREADHRQRRELTRRLRMEFAALGELLDIPAQLVDVLDLIHEDCAVAGESFQVGGPLWEEVHRHLVPLMEHFELGHLQHAPGMVRFVTEQIGHGRSTTAALQIMATFGAYQDELLSRFDPAYHALVPSLRRTTMLLQQLNQQALRQWAGNTAQRVVELDVRQLPRHLPSLRGWPVSLTFFLQIAAASPEAWQRGDYLLVLNHTYNGLGSYIARFCGLYDAGDGHDPLTERLRQHFASLSEHVELVDLPLLTDASDLQLHPRLTRRSLQWPADAADERSLPLSACDLVHDPEQDAIRLIERATGREILPIYLGSVYPLTLPHPARAFINTLTPISYAYSREFWHALTLEGSSIDDQHGSSVRHRPRVQIGRVVLARELWQVPVDQVPQPMRGESDADYFWRVYRWKGQLGLPEIVFVRANVKVFDAIAKHSHKPLYLDFQNPWLVLALPRLLNNAVDSLIFTEMLPGGEELPVTFNGAAVVSELQIEVNWIERGGVASDHSRRR